MLYKRGDIHVIKKEVNKKLVISSVALPIPVSFGY